MINTIVMQTYYCLDISKWCRFGTDSPMTPTTYFLDFLPRNMRRLLTNTQNSQRLKWETSPCQCKNIKHAREISAKSIDFQRNLPRKFPQNQLLFTDCFMAKIAAKISAKFPPNWSIFPRISENPTKFGFFSRNLSEALYRWLALKFLLLQYSKQSY